MRFGIFLVSIGVLAGVMAGCNSAKTPSAEPSTARPGGSAELPGDKQANPNANKALRESANKSKKIASGKPAAELETAGEAWFDDVSAATGIDFVHVSGNSKEKPFPAANGSGVGAIDFDRDGNYDLYFATGCMFPIELNSESPTNRLYQNLGGLKFRDISSLAHVRCNGFSAGIAVGDYDSDGFPDIYVNCFGPNILFRNLGDGTFERAENEAGVADPRWGTSAAFMDMDGDGLLDLYVCNYAKWSWETHQFCGDEVRQIRTHCGPRTVEGERDILYRNQGDGTFVDVLEAAGLAQRACRGQGVVAADVNDDGYADLYVGNDLHPNFLFLNNRDGTFRDATESSGAAYDMKGTSQAGMGVDMADVNGDGRIDLFVTNFAMEYNSLYLNTGHDFFQEVSNRFGLSASSLPWVGWGANFVDFDHDGALDLVVTNGHVDDNRHLFEERAEYAQPGLLYRGAKGKFELVGKQSGAYFEQSHVGRGLSTVDLDNDGDVDLVITHQDAAPAVLVNRRNRSSERCEETLRVRLVGSRSNRDAIGATVRISQEGNKPGGKKTIMPIKSGSSYLSSHDLRLLIPVPDRSKSVSLDIRWPTGEENHVDDLQSGHDYVILEPHQKNASATVICSE